MTSDQRGRLRESRGHVDIGAFELQCAAPVFTGLARSGNDIALSFVTEVGQNYRVESTDILAPAAWTIVADNLPGNGSSRQVIDTGGATHPQRFYRARAQL